MWWNIIPAYLIVTASIAVPGYVTYLAHYLFLGNCIRRGMDDRWDRHMYQRDTRITGFPYTVTNIGDFDFDSDSKKSEKPKDEEREKKDSKK